MGWRKGGSGAGFSNCLQLPLLFILGMVVLKCQTVPVAEKTPPQPRLSLLENDKTDSFLGDQVGKSREKRSSDDVELRYLDAEGLDPSRLVPVNGSGTWANGKTCKTGQEPLNETEVEITRKQLQASSDELGIDFKSALYASRGLLLYVNQASIRKDNCASKECHIDLPRLSLVCGPIPKKFADGKSCIDGSEPSTKEAFLKTKTAKKHGLKTGSEKIDPGKRTEFNEEAQEWFGKNCEKGNCYYAAYRGHYICGSPKTTTEANSSTSTQSFLLLILTFLTTSSILRRTFLS